MNNLIRKKVILCLLDSGPKSVDEIAGEIGGSLATVKDEFTALVSENICETVSPDEVSQYVVRKDIETFAQLVEEFISNVEEHKQETEHFITSEYYFSRIDNQLVDYVLSRFYLDSFYEDGEDKEGLRRALLASPSALIFALHDDTTFFRELRSSQNRLSASDSTRDMFTEISRLQFQTPILKKLAADMSILTYASLHAKLELQAVKISIQVGLATSREKYVEAMGGKSFNLGTVERGLRAGQLISPVDPMTFSYNGLAWLHLGEFQAALECFDKALNSVEDSTQKAIILNNKGLAFLQFRQYRKAIECFDEGIALDSDDEIPLLRQNKQIAEEYLARATDRDNLTEPTQIRFIQGVPVPFEETLFYEFKEIMGSNPVRSITNDSDEYTVAYLNREGGRIFWGIRDQDRITTGVTLNDRKRNETRRNVTEKLRTIRPSISVEDWQLEFHYVYDLQGGIVEDLWVIELVIPSTRERNIFYTSSNDLFVKTEGGKQTLQGPEATEFILRRLQNDTETD
ncbi:hypothetical protein C6496_02205 [Candidatus Poribacteria bacterium]|nr:MAG: hypothetical protein C6496_02205 [Candidatus Poribacteria bacterium]